MVGIGDTPLLTLGQVEKWRQRRAELEAQIAAANDELTVIVRKLSAASEFLEPAKGHEAASSQTPPKANGAAATPTVTLPEAILKTVAPYGDDGATPGEIKLALQSSGFDMAKIEANPGYVYTVLHRLLTRKKLERRRNGAYRLAPKPSSPEGEPGAVAAPGSH